MDWSNEDLSYYCLAEHTHSSREKAYNRLASMGFAHKRREGILDGYRIMLHTATVRSLSVFGFKMKQLHTKEEFEEHPAIQLYEAIPSSQRKSHGNE